MNFRFIIAVVTAVLPFSASLAQQVDMKPGAVPTIQAAIAPSVVTEQVNFDSDDPAIWIHPTDPSASLIIGTDKDTNGALFVFDLNGKIIHEKTVMGLRRPNNVDVAYGFSLWGTSVDIAVTTERYENRLRVFIVPDMEAIDGGGIEVFKADSARAPMGIALYKRPSDGTHFAIVSRKSGSTEGYLWQYRLKDDGTGKIIGDKVREFGRWSGIKEIEAIAVDDRLGYVYYSDENAGIRKYHADPDHPHAEKELAFFGTEGFIDDREGISIYDVSDSTGYILVSDQQANRFHIFPREGSPGNPHDHPLIKTVLLSTNESDGSDVTSLTLDPRFSGGLFVAMSDNRTYHFYPWIVIAGEELAIRSE